MSKERGWMERRIESKSSNIALDHLPTYLPTYLCDKMMDVRSILSPFQDGDDGDRDTGGIDIGHLGDVLMNPLTSLAEERDDG